MRVSLRTIKRRLDKAIACAEERGAKLKPEVTLQYGPLGNVVCCPIGAYAYCEMGASPNANAATLYKAGPVLGLEGREVDAFVYGFDGFSGDHQLACIEFPALYRLGKQYREQAGF